MAMIRKLSRKIRVGGSREGEEGTELTTPRALGLTADVIPGVPPPPPPYHAVAQAQHKDGRLQRIQAKYRGFLFEKKKLYIN